MLAILKEYLYVFFCAMVPLIELRGSVIIGAGMGMPWYANLVLSVIGNMLPVPFILLFIRKILAWMHTTKHFKGIAQWLEKYPSIQAVIDVHRDAVEYADGTAKYLSATLADGTVSAPLMLVVGTDKGGLYHPNWQDNLAWCVKLQALLERENAGLCRPLNLRKERFNGHFTPKSFILEVGTTGNTLPEALVAVKTFGESFADLWELNTVN